VRSRGFGLASGKVKERLGSLASEKAVSLIAIHAHEIPQAFSPAALREGRGGKNRRRWRAAKDWRDVPLVTIDPPDAKDHDGRRSRRAGPPIRIIRAALSSTSPSPTSHSMCGRDRRWTATR